MILYYAPGACSQACHIALIEAGMSYRLVKVGRDKQTDDGRDFKTINPKGYTPALELDDGTILTENLVILAYIADKSGKLLARDGLDHWRALEATAFMTTEIHSNFRPFFFPDATQAEKEKAGMMLVMRFGTIAEQLGDKTFLIGAQMTIADAYLFVMLAWAAMMGIAVPERLGAYSARMKSVPSVAQALAEEGFARA
ncbi:glutathione S-transferase N-terminal domain-containing protein [Methylocapsa sp. S129]|uniref:glutathione S-transferase N-terminal domain-containing protein n=1 Tax=Methylocapsa sp. S129 TaxID=1641869 RepID=UPI00131C8BDB|nr:glutathione S-transferase N-terminal domain-containing protein [Methylocapsa sp. S129]